MWMHGYAITPLIGLPEPDVARRLKIDARTGQCSAKIDCPQGCIEHYARACASHAVLDQINARHSASVVPEDSKEMERRRRRGGGGRMPGAARAQEGFGRVNRVRGERDLHVTRGVLRVSQP